MQEPVEMSVRRQCAEPPSGPERGHAASRRGQSPSCDGPGTRLRHPPPCERSTPMPDTNHGALRHRRLTRRPVVLTGLLVMSLWMTASPPPAAADPVADWNATALSALLAAGHNNLTVARGLTMVQVAVHDALNAIERRYDGYMFEGPAEANASPEAAVAT